MGGAQDVLQEMPVSYYSWEGEQKDSVFLNGKEICMGDNKRVGNHELQK